MPRTPSHPRLVASASGRGLHPLDGRIVERALILVFQDRCGAWPAIRFAAREAGMSEATAEAAQRRLLRKLQHEAARWRPCAAREVEEYEARLAAFARAFPEACDPVTGPLSPSEVEAAFVRVDAMLAPRPRLRSDVKILTCTSVSDASLVVCTMRGHRSLETSPMAQPARIRPRPVTFLGQPEVCRRVLLSPSQIKRLERAGRFPARTRLGFRTVGWSDAEIDQWVAQRLAARGGGLRAVTPEEPPQQPPAA